MYSLLCCTLHMSLKLQSVAEGHQATFVHLKSDQLLINASTEIIHTTIYTVAAL